MSFGPQKRFGDLISYILLAGGRFLTAIGTHGISINGYLLGNFSFLMYNLFYV
jgi:hypothetical protein